MSAVIELTNVGKRYWKLDEQAMLLKSIIPGYRAKRTEQWAVRNLDLRLERGETLGIIGHNGAGKTTLLRMLAGVSRPTEGRLFISGQVAPLIGVGVGFHLEMSGRENILVNGMLLGLSRRQVKQRFDEIVEFAELQEFIDTPVKFYSSGMYMRLGFSVAVHVNPDVLLVDEVLAVGDLAFQRKCFDRMHYLHRQGATIIIVSHSMEAIRRLCPRAVLLRKGRLELDGSAEEVIARHHELMSSVGEADGGTDRHAPVAVISRSLEDAHGNRTYHPRRGETLFYRLAIRFNRPVQNPLFFFRVTSEQGVVCYQTNSVARPWRDVTSGEVLKVEVTFKASLGGGSYRLGLYVADQGGREILLNDATGTVIFLSPSPGSAGIAELEANISADGRRVSEHQDLLLSSDREDVKSAESNG